tara:strand:+ start:515 stop:820 length:306 start_codon:yes stop_codon:yes gene_type:complete
MQNERFFKKNNINGKIVIKILHRVKKGVLYPKILLFNNVIVCIKEKAMSVCSGLLRNDTNTRIRAIIVFTNGSKVIIRNINEINRVYLILIFGIRCIIIYS